ncbi:MAG: HAMP domain-containing sensor histidine kinase [Ferruginibacter sp.]
MPKHFIVFFCLLISLQSVSQTAGNSHIQIYTTDNGLPSNGIKGMQWDEKTEFLWLATEAGIVRFNGADIKSYTKETMPEITSERMLFIMRNNAGTIYTSDQQGNIFSIDKNTPALWRKSDVSNGLNTQLGGYYLLAVSDTFFKKYSDVLVSSTFSASVDKIVCISDTSFIMSFRSSLYYRTISSREAVALPFEKGNINTIFKIGENCFIVTNKKEFFLFNTKDQTISSVVLTKADDIFNSTANSILYWQTGMLNPFVIAGENAWKLNYDGKALSAQEVFTGIPPDSYIISIQYSEKNGLLFIGTESKGLIVINQNRIASKKRHDPTSKNRNSYYSQIELDNGNILTNESDIIGDNSTTKPTLPIQGKFSFNISLTDNNLLWYSQADPKIRYNCLHQYNKTTGQTTMFPKIKRGEIVASSGNRIYLASPSGIGVLDGDSLLWLYQYPKELSGTLTFDFTEISPGILGIATCAGLLRFNTGTHTLDTIFSKENICVRSIWKYKDYIFFGSYGSGFYIYKNGLVKSMPLDKNKYLLYPHCFVPDDEGFCWISTNRGLFKSSLAELIGFFENTSTSVYYHYFGKKDGMETTELNGGCTPCALRMLNNTISFPTMDGLLWVDPQKAIPILPNGEIYIDEIIADNKKFSPASLKHIELPANTGEIVVKLGFSSWCNKENIYLDYQLNDASKWIPVNIDNDAVIRLINLSSGKYNLRIRKMNGFGINDFSYKEISFTISTPWNKQWWFYLLLFLTALSVVALFMHFRTRQYKIQQYKLERQVAEKTKKLQDQNEILEKNNTIKTRLISIISHDIVTPLRFVTVAGKNLIEKRSLMSEELQQETIQEITNTSQELQLLSTNILNWIKYQNENRRLAKESFILYDMTNQVMGVLNSLAKQKKITLENTVDPGLQIYQYFEPLKILVYNLLTNAINFSEKGSIIISAIPVDEKLSVTVKDEGAGMTVDQIKNIMADQFIISSANIDNRKGNGLGYLIIKDLVKMMNATLHINSEKGKGTTVSVLLTIAKN